MDRVFLQARIDATKAQIVAYEDAITTLASGVQSYTLDTRQNRQTVTRADISALQKSLDSLYNRCATLEARLNGSGTVNGGAAW